MNDESNERASSEDCKKYAPADIPANNMPDVIDDEVWSEIPGFSRYQASNYGRVRSKDVTKRTVDRYGHKIEYIVKGKMLHQYLNMVGYPTINIQDDNGKYHVPSTHSVIMLAFTGIPAKVGVRCVDHKDCNKLNNKLENLEYVSYKENTHRAKSNGLLHGKRKVLCVDDNKEFDSVSSCTTYYSFYQSSLKTLFERNDVIQYSGKTFKLI
jgi:hypothetical protein